MTPTKLLPNSDVIEQRMDEQFILLHLRTNQVYQLNSTGARLWELLRDDLDLAQIEERLLEEFDVSAEQLEQELQSMIAVFQEQKLVTIYE